MEIKDINTLIERLDLIEKNFGLWGLIIATIIVVILVMSWKYLIKRSELIAENTSEKYLKKFQSHLDQELIKFQTKHEMQVNAIHETFQKFQKLKELINYIFVGENFTQKLNPHNEVQFLITFRHDFKKIYLQNRLLFSEQLCNKIEAFILNVDRFIETYNSGLFPEPTEEEKEFNSEHNGGVFIAGVWSVNAFDGLEELEQISKGIETEFKKIYGTNEKN